MNLYFIDKHGENFRATVFCRPYFYVEFKDSPKKSLEISHFLQRKFESHSIKVEVVDKEDLTLPNHLSGKRRTCLKLSFNTVS